MKGKQRHFSSASTMYPVCNVIGSLSFPNAAVWSFVMIGLIRSASTVDISKQASPAGMIHNVRCEVQDLELTIKWNVTDVDRTLKMRKYIVGFCTLTECGADSIQKIKCYDDEERTKRTKRLKESTCRANIAQLFTWNMYKFIVTAVYRNVTSRGILRISNSTVCQPISRETTLSAPLISTRSTKSSITIELELPQNLKRSLNITEYQGEFGLTDVTYYYHLTPKGRPHDKMESWNHVGRKVSLNNYETYENIRSNEDYDVQGWYTINILKNDASDVATTTEKTKPDYFPQWAQIALVCGLSAAIIWTMATAILVKEYQKQKRRINSECSKPTDQFMQLLDEVKQANTDLCFIHKEWEDDWPMDIPRLSFTGIVFENTTSDEFGSSPTVSDQEYSNEHQDTHGCIDTQYSHNDGYEEKSALAAYVGVAESPATLLDVTELPADGYLIKSNVRTHE